MSKKRPQQKKGGQALWIVAGVAVIAVGVLVGISLLSSKGDETPAPVAVEGVKTDAELKGNRTVRGTGKVVVTEYGDYL